VRLHLPLRKAYIEIELSGFMEIDNKEVDARKIMVKLAKLQKDMDFVREHIEDVSLTDDDLISLKEARKDLKEGKTRRL
jgi:ABC-type lipoprotein release transport system permease subunit